MSSNLGPSTSKSPLEAAQKIVAELTGMTLEHQTLSIKFAMETLGLQLQSPSARPAAALSSAAQHPTATPASPSGGGHSTDIKSFTALKAPKSDQQFVAVVAYFYQFEAPANQHKDSIDATVMKDAARLAVWQQPKDWNQTLNNALRSGYLDRAERGAFKLSSVGENLVAITLPDNASLPTARKKNSKTNSAKKVKKLTPQKAKKSD